jgi:NAD kinase
VYVEEKTFEHELFMGNESIREAMLNESNPISSKQSGGSSSKEHNRQCHSRIRRFPTNMIRTSHMVSTPECVNNRQQGEADSSDDEHGSHRHGIEPADLEYLERDEIESKIDFIICLGGDGELLTCSSIFQRSCPPVISIHSDLLGFLCPFSFSNYAEYLRFVIKGIV